MRDREPARGIEGELVQRGDADYDAILAGMVWNGRKPERCPELIVRAASERDVPGAIGLARRRGLRIAVRAGGHSWCGSSARSDGMLIDLSRLRRCDIRTAPATAAVQPAVTGSELAPELAERGFSFPTGHCGSVAVGGYLLGGGLGWNSGALGPACRSVHEIEAVTADGETVRCNKDENPGLLWAARGAGPGFFAVVTRFHLRLHRLPAAIMSTTFVLPLADLHEVTNWAIETARGLQPTVELTLVLATAAPHMTRARPRPKVITVAATAFADSREQAVQALGPLRNCPFADRSLFREADRPTSFNALYKASDDLWPAHHRYAADTLWSDSDLGTLLSRFSDAVERAPSDNSLVLVPVSPASHNEELLHDMAFSVLGSSYVVPYAIWDDAADDDINVRWLRETMSTVEPLGTGHYIAEADLGAVPSRAERSYTARDWRRLQELRGRYDPEGIFHSYLTP
ncbi:MULTISPECIES: FAD-binding oxidoreductase [unclassified Streptomyces]|uniref:FAD-binding oxidoreductase n=1 Tax=unclassified Streptomyces TaxID=2593676 RepID=UPI0035E302DF